MRHAYKDYLSNGSTVYPLLLNAFKPEGMDEKYFSFVKVTRAREVCS